MFSESKNDFAVDGRIDVAERYTPHLALPSMGLTDKRVRGPDFDPCLFTLSSNAIVAQQFPNTDYLGRPRRVGNCTPEFQKMFNETCRFDFLDGQPKHKNVILFPS